MIASARQALIASLLSVVLAMSSILTAIPYAYADSDEVQAAIDKMDAAASKYEDISEKSRELDQRVADGESKIAALEDEIDNQRDKSNAAVSSMYRYQRSTSSLIDLVLSTDDVGDFFGTLEYLNRYESNVRSIIDDQSARYQELKYTQEVLTSDKAAADKSKEEARAALDEARVARDEAIEKAAAEAAAAKEAEERAAQEAAEEAAKQAAIERSRALAASDSGAEVDDSDVDLNMDKQAFVDKWAPRIDAYLDGSPLGGYGYLFASAAWDNGVDPRWSPAISTVESSKGRYCFRTYNAWGWGSVNWDSWEESIPKHVNGLARLYGYTLTMAAAYKYNYETPVDWYNKVASEMSKI